MVNIRGQSVPPAMMTATSFTRPAWLQWAVVICLCLAGVQSYALNRTKVITNVLDHLLDGYNKEIRPGIGGKSLVIKSSILIKSMGPVSENDMSYSMQVYFRQRWKDERLSFFLDNVTEFTLSNRFINNIWKPNSYFINGRNSKQHNITVPNAFVRLSADGSIYMSVRLTVNARCPMALSRYPMDRVVCPLFIGSFGYTTDELIYTWENQVGIDPGVKVSQFELGRIEQQQLSKQGRYGELSILEVYIHMSRAVGFYVLQTYVPCYLIVVISWISFWINRDAAPARVLLGVTTILSTAAIGMTVREGLPRVPYATALDVFLNVCILYEMAALIEYAAVNYFTMLRSIEAAPPETDEEEEEEEAEPMGVGAIQKRVSGHTDPHPLEQESLLVTNSDGGQRPVVKLNRPDKWRCSQCLFAFWKCLVGSTDYRSYQMSKADPDNIDNVSTIDIVARVLFPLTFSVFNLCYWLMYFYLEVS